ncbi:hypothetical protein K227x_28660 [Rubripirellula lacrimiformis]|uniref:Uncharacterized protein n=1 Tax=Rubripirellula lacrimiformis TaxID=1930273 RepID=A0A517NBG1_9BACT|nr:hypothetical protein K227x_28660 [Rubripirellula lacrimiformis]
MTVRSQEKLASKTGRMSMVQIVAQATCRIAQVALCCALWVACPQRIPVAPSLEAAAAAAVVVGEEIDDRLQPLGQNR